jgi:hypothetical protein
MYVAEICGKISSNLECSEDILTSNVFSLFKYADRCIFLGNFLNTIGIEATVRDLENAEFIFWPSYGDGTEPDVVILVGKHYLLFEAKYFSGFGEAYGEKEHQLLREIEGGLADARNYSKEFSLIAITDDICFDRKKYRDILGKHFGSFRWANWQSITTMLLRLLERDSIGYPSRLFAEDLYELMCRKGLRSFRGFGKFGDSAHLNVPDSIFLPSTSIRYGGVFNGFTQALDQSPPLIVSRGGIFYQVDAR